jgi:hypothetical protein
MSQHPKTSFEEQLALFTVPPTPASPTGPARQRNVQGRTRPGPDEAAYVGPGTCRGCEHRFFVYLEGHRYVAWNVAAGELDRRCPNCRIHLTTTTLAIRPVDHHSAGGEVS